MSLIYWAVYPSAQADPSIAQVIAGTVPNAAASGSDTAPATDGTFSDIATGLSPSASYKIAAVWSDGVDDSARVVSAAFDTLSADTEVNASAASLGLTAHAASLEYDRDVASAVASLGLQPYQAGVALGVSVQAGTVAFNLSAYTASIARDVEVSAVAASLAVSSHAASIARGVEVSGAAASLALSSHAATVASASGDADVQAAAASLTLSAHQASVANNVTVQASAASLSLTSSASSVALNADIGAVHVDLTLQSYQAGVLFDRRVVDCQSANLALSPYTAAVNVAPAYRVDGDPPMRKNVDWAAVVARVEREPTYHATYQFSGRNFMTRD